MYKIFTIGPGNETLESFILRLQKHSINCLVDFRSQPYSQYVPQFNRENLSGAVSRYGLEYLYFGDKLGGRPSEGFEKFRDSEKFEKNVDLLLSQIGNKAVALMCSEFEVSKCHRRFIVEEIIKRGIQVLVVDKEGSASQYTPQPLKKSTKQEELESKNQTKLTGF